MTEPTKEQVELPEDLAHTVAVARSIKEKIKELQEELDDLNSVIRTHGEAEYTLNGEPVLSVTPTRRFSADKAKTILPPELAALCVEETITSSKAKQVLPPEVYAKCQEDGSKSTVRYL